MITNIQCWTMIDRSVDAYCRRDNKSHHPRLAAYLLVFGRACNESGAPAAAASPRLICLASRLADLLS